MGTSNSADWTYLTPALAVEVLILLLVAGFWLWVCRQNAVHVGVIRIVDEKNDAEYVLRAGVDAN
jgi:hypothetical protein